MILQKFKFTVIFHFLFSKLWWNNFECIWNHYLYNYFNWIWCKYLWCKYLWCKYFWNTGIELFTLISQCGKHSQVSLFGILVPRPIEKFGAEVLVLSSVSEVLLFDFFWRQYILKLTSVFGKCQPKLIYVLIYQNFLHLHIIFLMQAGLAYL